MRILPLGAAIGALAWFSACSSSGDGGSGQSPVSAGGADVYPAPHAPFPKVTYQGGPLVTAPKIVTVTFPGDALASDLATFGASVASSSWWDAVRGDFCASDGKTCVGDGPAGTAIALTTAPGASYTDSAQGGASTLQTYLAGLVTSGDIPAPDASTIYVFYFPKTTTIVLDGQKACAAFDGYHNVAAVGSSRMRYAIVPECAPSEKVSLLAFTTATAAHEIIEAASDPDSPPGYYLDTNDPATWGWNDVQGGEVADLCSDPFSLGQDLVADGAYTAQRIWSPKNAAANKNPCLPVPLGEVYFNASPEAALMTLDVGASKTIEVTAFSDAKTDAWTLTAQDWSDPSTTYLKFSIAGGASGGSGPQVQVNNGSKVQLTVTLVADPGNSPNGEADAVLVSSNGDPASATKANYWPFVVMTPGEAADAGVSGKEPRFGGHPNKSSHKRRVR